MTYLRPPMKLGDTKNITLGPKFIKLANFRDLRFYGFMVVFWFGSNDLSEATNEFPRTNTCILYLICHCSSKIVQNHGYICDFCFVLFGFSFDFCQNHECPCRAGCIDTSHSQIRLKKHEIHKRTD